MKIRLSIILLLCSSIIHGTARNINEKLEDAILDDRYEDAKAALQAGANPNAPLDESLNTAFHSATLYNDEKFIKFIKLLLNYHANPNKSNIRGNTPLHYAILQHKPDIISLLLNAATDIESRDNVGHTPLDIVSIYRGNNVFEVTHLLLKAGVNVNIKNQKGNTPLHSLSRRHSWYRGSPEKTNLLNTAKLLAIFSNLEHLESLTAKQTDHDKFSDRVEPNKELKSWLLGFINDHSLWRDGRPTRELMDLRSTIRTNDSTQVRLLLKKIVYKGASTVGAAGPA